MQRKSSPAADIGLGIVLIVVAGIIIYGTLELPAGSFEPLGSARIPQVVAGGIIIFSVWIIAAAVAQRRHGESADGTVRAFRPRHDLSIGLVALTTVYVAVMAMDWLRFSIATLAFLLIAISMLCGPERRALPLIVVLAAVFGFGLEYLFTHVFVIDLP